MRLRSVVLGQQDYRDAEVAASSRAFEAASCLKYTFVSSSGMTAPRHQTRRCLRGHASVGQDVHAREGFDLGLGGESVRRQCRERGALRQGQDIRLPTPNAEAWPDWMDR